MASRPIPGATVSGDLDVVVGLEGSTLVGVIDGLGHGPEAQVAADVAAGTIRRCAEEPLDELMRSCHQAMIGTRGAAITLLGVADGGRLDWLAVGNVEAAVLRGGRTTTGAIETVYHFPGIVGDRLPRGSDDALLLVGRVR